MQQSQRSKVVIVSNRLPITIEEANNGFDFKSSAGGLATGLSGLDFNGEINWVGWPGPVNRQNQRQVSEQLQILHDCTPVFLPERLIERYYDGFSNKTLWPLFHSFQSYARYSLADWQGYVEANERFLQVLSETIRPGDRVWIHDYQLMLLPGLLRQRFPELTIGFFLHIPFPPFDVLRLLPQHKAILQGLLSADLIGFHTHDYSRAFLNGVHRVFGLDDHLGKIIAGERIVETVTHPMGIDFERFSSASVNLDQEKFHQDLNAAFAHSKVVFSVSRLDYTKGIPQSLAAFELLLERRPDLHKKTTYILCVVPSREKVDRYNQLKREIDEAVGRINAKFGSVEWTPIRYLYRSLTFEELVSLYKASHVALVTPLRDGLNLVAKEFIASRTDDRGVLILSELAGASKELLEAIQVNPNSRDEIRYALEKALDMSEAEQIIHMKALKDRLLENPIDGWGKEFLSRMDRGAQLANSQRKKSLNSDNFAEIVSKSKDAKRRLFVLDYDGTLTPLVAIPDHAAPDEHLKELLRSLSEDPKSDVVIVSGRNKNDMSRWIGDFPITLVAEHGAWIKLPSDNEWKSLCGGHPTDWMADVRKSLESFVENIPGSWLEEKDLSLVWHYRRSDPQSADIAAKDLVFHLLGIIGEHPVRIVPGKKTIEVRSIYSGKGSSIKNNFDLRKYDFIFAAGDDLTDEDLFSALSVDAISIKVGSGFSKAAYRVRDSLELRKALSGLLNSADTLVSTGEIKVEKNGF